MIAASTGVPVQVLIVVAIAGAAANIVASIASMVQAVVAVRRLEAQAQTTRELTQRIARHVGVSEENL